MRFALVVFIALTTLAACGGKTEVTPVAAPQASAPATPTPAPIVSPGKLKYAGVCQGCHGRDGAGQGPFPKLAGKPATELAAKLKDYRAGKSLGPQSSTMMPFAKALNDAEIDAISEYLAAL